MKDNRWPESWMDIHGFVGLYKISNRGRVRHFPGGSCDGPFKDLKLNSISDGYVQIILHNGWIHIPCKVHRLVAIHFVKNPGANPTVNHIDENKSNNHYDNLEWVTHSENKAHSSAKQAIQINLDGKQVKVWDSVRSTRDGGFEYKNVSACCRGIRKTHLGFRWEFKEK